MITSPPRIPQELLDANRSRLDKNGAWYHDGVHITHERTIALFDRSIDWDADGKYYLQVGTDVIPIEVDDAPYRVMDASGDSTNGFTLVLSDQTTEALDPATLRIGPDDALYCTVKEGAAPARFTRTAHNRLAQWIKAESDDGENAPFVLVTGGQRYPVTHR